MRRFVSATFVVALVVAVAGTASPAHAAGQMCFPRVAADGRGVPVTWQTRARTTGVSAISCRRRTSPTGDDSFCSVTPATTACIRTGVARRSSRSATTRRGCSKAAASRCSTTAASGGASWIVPPGSGRQRLLARRSRGRRQSPPRLPRADAARTSSSGRRSARPSRPSSCPRSSSRASRTIPFDGGTFYGGGAVYDGGYLYAYGWQDADCAVLRRTPRSGAGARGPRAGSERVAVRRGRVVVERSARGAARAPRRDEPARRTAVQQRLPARHQAAEHLRRQRRGVVGAEPGGALERRSARIYDIPLPPRSHIPGQTYNSPFTYMASLTPSAAVERRRDVARVQREHLRRRRCPTRRPHGRPPLRLGDRADHATPPRPVPS